MDQRIRIAKGLHLYRQAASPHWWADLHVGGRRARRSTGTSSRKDAERIARRFLEEARKVVGVNHGYSLYHALADWLDKTPRGRTDISVVEKIKGKPDDEKNPVPPLLPNRPAALVDNSVVREAFAALSPGNANRYMAVVHAALKLAFDAGKGVPPPPTFVKFKGEKKRTRWLRPAEIEKLLAALPPHLKAPAEFSLLTGLRRGNVLGLQWGQVVMFAGLVVFDGADMKSGKPHAVPLTPRALEILKAQKEVKDCPYVFTYRGKSIGTPKTAWLRAVKKAGLEDVRWHDMRHTWASHMAMSGATLNDIKEAGGWASMEMVARYSHLGHERLSSVLGAAASTMFSTSTSTTPTSPPSTPPATPSCAPPTSGSAP